MRTRTKTTNETDPPSRSAWIEVMGPLSIRERRFVRALLNGESWEAAAERAQPQRQRGIASSSYALTASRLLGAPRVAIAIKRLAPLLTDASLAARLLAPYARAAMARNLDGSAQARLGAARDVLALASDPGGSPVDTWRQRQEARKSAKPQAGTQADNIHYGNSTPGAPPKGTPSA